MRTILFWGLILGLKVYVYISLVRLFKQTRYRRIAGGLGAFSFLVLATGLYLMFNNFSQGIVQPSPYSNFGIGLMVTFLVVETLLGIVFILDDLLGFGRWSVQKVRGVEAIAPRRKFLKRAGTLLAGIPFLSFLHGITLGKYNFTVHKQQVYFPDLPEEFDGFTLAQISDVHAGSFDNSDAVRAGVQLLGEQNADLIVFTGDLVNTYAREIEPYLGDFKALSAPYGKFSILGNHDYPRFKRMFDSEAHGERNLAKIKEHHATMGFNLLLNDSTELKKGNASIRLAGVENWGRSRHFPKLGDLDQATITHKKDDFTILLSHDPTHWEDHIKTYKKTIHLTLSGHTHGMQMGIDLPAFKWSPIKYVYKHWAGLYEEAGRYLYVNRGFGFLAFAGRVGVFPEITLLELKRGTKIT